MTIDTTRDLLISLSSHMAYMQGQLEAHHELDDLEDFYWYRESVALRQKVTDALAEETAVPLPVADAVATAESECLYVLSTATDRPLTPHLIEDFYRQFCGIIEGLVDALGKDKPTEPAPPADGEVAELVAQLKSRHYGPGALDRAAELLERQALVPVAVSERPWEREGWCDAEGNCWLGANVFDGAPSTWLYGPSAWAERFPHIHRVLLPAHALPLPEVGE